MAAPVARPSSEAIPRRIQYGLRHTALFIQPEREIDLAGAWRSLAERWQHSLFRSGEPGSFPGASAAFEATGPNMTPVPLACFAGPTAPAVTAEAFPLAIAPLIPREEESHS